jgi:hypothetical protein
MWSVIRQKKDTQTTKPGNVTDGLYSTTTTIAGGIHQSPNLEDRNPNGRQGNDWRTPTQESFVEEQEGRHNLEIAISHLHEGPLPGRIARPWNDRNAGKLGKSMSGNPDGTIGLLLNISGVSAGGLGDAKYIQHLSVLRPAGKAAGSSRTIDDGAQVPATMLADPTRR